MLSVWLIKLNARVHIASHVLECSHVYMHSFFSVLLILLMMLIPPRNETVEGSKVCLLEFWSVFFFWTGYLQEFGRQVLLIISERGRDEGGLFDLRVIDNYSNKKFFLKFHSYNSGSSKLEPPDILIKEGGGRGKGKGPGERYVMTSLTYNIIQRSRKIINVVAVQSGHGYTPIHSQINVLLFYKPLTLLIADPRETKC